MGEATYYLKARYPDVPAAETAATQFRVLIREGVRAADFWQAHRGDADRAAFWQGFGEQFPLVADYLRLDAEPTQGEVSIGGATPGPLFGGDHNNALAGHLDFGNEGDEDNVSVDGFGEPVLRYSATVWHFAEWDSLAAWLRRVTGATAVAHLSDEYADPFDELAV
jgi:hypothetical protein